MRRAELDLVLTDHFWLPSRKYPMCCLRWIVRRRWKRMASSNPWCLDPAHRQAHSFPDRNHCDEHRLGITRQQLEDLIRHGSCDASYTLGEKARFRVNVFSQRGNYSIVCRQLNASIPTLEQLKLPEIPLKDIPRKNRPGTGDRRDRVRQIHDPRGASSMKSTAIRRFTW